MKFVYRQDIKGHTYYRFRKTGGGSVRLPDNPNSAEFRQAYARLTREPDAQVQLNGSKNVPLARLLRLHLIKITRAATWRAKKNGIPCDIDPNYILTLADSQKNRCAVSGLPFAYVKTQRIAFKEPFRPSIDRIVPAKGYVRGNVRLTLTLVNCAINEWGEDIFREVCAGVASSVPLFPTRKE